MNPRYTLRLLLILLLCGNLLSCSISKKAKHKKDLVEKKNQDYNFNMSLDTKLFLQELNQEKAAQEDIKYTPSDKLIEKYNIAVIEEKYTIGGFITVGDDYNKNDLSSLDISYNSQTGDITTVIIPLMSINKFLQLDGIKYFEINKKVELKK